MSILLNALKKSEAQRQVGGPPDIHAPSDVSPDRHTTGHRWLPLGMLAVTAVLIAWFGWQQYGPPDRETENVKQEVSETESVPAQVSQESAPDATSRPAVDTLEESSSAPVAVVNFPPKKSQEAQQRKQQLSRSFTQFEADPQPETGDDRPVEMEAEKDEFSELESTVNEIAQVESTDSSERMETQRRSSRSEPRSSESAEPEESEPISFWQIPQNLRDGMPEFRITVLVYAEQPEDRFLLVNGIRLVEKEELASGITLEEIRRDGAVFRYRNYRFLVKG